MRLRLSLVAIAIALTLSLLAPVNVQAQPTEYTLNQGPFQGIFSNRITGSDFINDTDLVLSLDMESLEFGKLDDLSGNNRYGPLDGTAVVAQFGVGRDFDGSSDMIVLENTTGAGLCFDRFDPFTVAVVINTTDTTGHIIGCESGTARGWMLEVSGGYLRFAMLSDLFTKRIYVRSTNLINDGISRLVMATFAGNSSAFGVEIYLNGVQETRIIDSNNMDTNHNVAGPIQLGRDTYQPQYYDGVIDEVLLIEDWVVNETEAEMFSVNDYTFIFDADIIPSLPSSTANYSNGWVRAENQTFRAAVNDSSHYTTNITAWTEGIISWNAYLGVDKTVRYNFSFATGTYPYWVNDTLQGNLSTVGGEIDFSWTDWLDGEHLFELGFEIISEPTELTGVEGDIFTYDAETSKTNATWSLETGPSWIFVDPVTGLVAGVMEPGGFVIVIAVTSSGIETTQAFALVVTPSPNDQIILIMLPIILGLFVAAPIFNLPTLWMLDGILTILFGIWTFNELGFPFYFAVGIMTFGGVLLMGGIVYALSMRGMLGKREKT